jgi:hypothetical protein
MTGTRTRHSIKTSTPLYLAFELGWNEWKLAFATGPADNPRLRSIDARNTDALLQEIAKAKKRFGLTEDAPVVAPDWSSSSVPRVKQTRLLSAIEGKIVATVPSGG